MVQISRSTVLSLLQRIEVGQLLVTDTDGSITTCGHIDGRDQVPRTGLKVLKEAFWIRLLLFADMVRLELIFFPEKVLPTNLRRYVGLLRKLHAGRIFLF